MLEAARRLFAAAVHARPVHLRIARSMILVSIFVGIGKFFGAAKEMAIAYHYGTTAEVDAFVIAYTWIGWMPVVFQGSVTLVAVPLLIGIQHDQAQYFLDELMGLALLLGTSVSLLAAFVFPALIQVVAPDSSPQVMEQTAVAMRAMAPTAVPITMSGVLFAYLLSRERHLNTLAESLPSLVLLMVLLLWPTPSAAGLTPLILGSSIGFVVMLIVLWLLTIRSGTRLALRFSHDSSAWQTFWSGVGLMTVNQLLLGLAMPLDQVMVSQVGEGAVAALSYAMRLLMLVLSLTALAIGRALLPVLSSIGAYDPDQARLIAKRWSGITFGIGLVLVLVGWILSPTAVRLVFERGAFTSEDTKVVAEILQYGLLHVPFYLINVVLSHFLASRRHYRFLAVTAMVAITVKIAGNYVLIQWVGLPAVLITTLVMSAMSSLLYLWRISHLPAQALQLKN